MNVGITEYGYSDNNITNVTIDLYIPYGYHRNGPSETIELWVLGGQNSNSTHAPIVQLLTGGVDPGDSSSNMDRRAISRRKANCEISVSPGSSMITYQQDADGACSSNQFRCIPIKGPQAQLFRISTTTTLRRSRNCWICIRRNMMHHFYRTFRASVRCCPPRSPFHQSTVSATSRKTVKEAKSSNDRNSVLHLGFKHRRNNISLLSQASARC